MLRYLEAFFRNRWLIVIPALLLVLSGSALFFFMVPTYGATIAVWTENTAYLDVPTSSDNQWLSPAANQAARINELLRTSTFAQAIADRLLGANAPAIERRELALDIRSGDMSATAAGDHILRINFWHPDPAIALGGPTAVVEQYNDVVRQSRELQATGALDFYQQRVKEYESTILPRVNQAVTDYLESHPEVNLNIREGNPTDPAFAIIQQQAQTTRQQYQAYKDRLDEIATQNQASITSLEASFRVIDPAGIMPGTGVVRKRTLIIFAAAGAAVALGYVALFLGLATELDRTLRNAGDVRRRLQLPVLDVIPEYTATGVIQSTRRFGRKSRVTAATHETIRS